MGISQKSEDRDGTIKGMWRVGARDVTRYLIAGNCRYKCVSK